jgi:drug/metabolite transporter (DMT)-like permease
MLAISMALVSAISWGTGDFLGGIQSRRFAVPIVLLGSSLGGLLFVGIIELGLRDSIPPIGDMWLGAIAGFISIFALAAFYRALEIGTMSIVAPISATGTAIPVIVGIIDGDDITLLAAIGLVVTVTGVMLASREQDEAAAASSVSDADHRTSILLAIVAAIGFGTIFVLIAKASTENIFWPAVALKGTTFIIMSVFMLLAWRRIPKPWPVKVEWAPLLLIGCFDVGANTTFALSSNHGQLSITAVVASMFPVTTVLLAYKFLGERLARLQLVGIVLALLGLAMLTLS